MPVSQKEKHLFLTPGVYELEDTIVAENPDTIVLGAGLATLRSMKGNACMKIVGDIPVTIAGILFDAGPEATECLFVLGEETESAEASDSAEVSDSAEAADPAEVSDPSDKYTLLADLFFRVGGAKTYLTDVSLCALINQDNVVGDNFWVWRADHGSGVSWTQNKAKNGIRVTGDNVTIYALMVEHFQEYQTIWEGENGKVIFYQCEIPYDVPNQQEWISNDGTVMITGNPGISHIINDEGGHVYNAGEREVIVEYPGED